MGGVSGGKLASAVREGGGLGGRYGDPKPVPGGAEYMEREFRAAGNSRIGLGNITRSLAKFLHLFELALASGATAIFHSSGDGSPFADRMKEAGLPLICQVYGVVKARGARKSS